MLTEVKEVSEESAAAIEAKATELGVELFRNLFRRLALQMIDTLWVEHLEVMAYTRSSVNLRAYGQRDPLIEYRKEGTRLFKEMQQVIVVRISEVLPKLQPVVVEREEAVMKKQSEAAQAAAGETGAKKKANEPIRATDTIGRNDLVTISDGTQTQEVKYKKAEPLLSTGTWKIISK